MGGHRARVRAGRKEGRTDGGETNYTSVNKWRLLCAPNVKHWNGIRKEALKKREEARGKDDHDNADIAERDGRGRVASGRVIKHRL